MSARGAAALTALLAACSGACSGADAPPRHLVLVTLDTLRRDRCGPYADGPTLTPHLDRLAERGIVFEDALCQAVSTPPSHASILTGLAVEVLFVPALVVVIVALIVSIVGIPLLATIPFVLAAFAFIWVAGFTGVAVRIGRALRGRGDSTEVSVVNFLIGYTIIIGITVFAQLMAYGLGWLSPATWPMRSAGLLVEYVAWTVGLGAAVTSLFAPRRLSPPPIPV